ncbi:hypothetical protein LA080_004900 [Diaporthe eres]|uniref:Uncharacterized protein n=1 Tax=Diaporthe vaccinii TaxID=105482 RepID=A0ABR4EHI3_9PEZI|nr:hypothetical protein LA080_004900 [Diaporthe eres]
MQLKRTLPLIILPLLTGTALGASCYDKGQQWKDVGTESVLDEAFRRVCDKTNLAGEYKRKEAIRTCENVAGHSFLVTIQHIDSLYGLDPWYLSSGTCFDLLKKVYYACPDRGGSMIVTGGGGEDMPWVAADVRLDPENSCCNC